LDRPKRDPPVIVDSDPSWARLAIEWITSLSNALAPLPVRIEHVGSTAVPGLAAKPVLDIQIAVPDINDEQAYRPALESLGLVLRAREPGHHFFRPPADQPRTVHVHVCEHGSDWERSYLLFRDYLRAHPDRAAEYAQLKRTLATATTDRQTYTNGKDAFIQEALLDAAEWAKNHPTAASWDRRGARTATRLPPTRPSDSTLSGVPGVDAIARDCRAVVARPVIPIWVRW
jgi:GrpB-like predicted nucleotidyltransferase (UPF0157 family)